MQVALRLWDEDIRPELEFRCFVVDHAIVAITQYHKACYVPAIAQQGPQRSCVKQEARKQKRMTLGRGFEFLASMIVG